MICHRARGGAGTECKRSGHQGISKYGLHAGLTFKTCCERAITRSVNYRIYISNIFNDGMIISWFKQSIEMFKTKAGIVPGRCHAGILLGLHHHPACIGPRYHQRLNDRLKINASVTRNRKHTV